MNIMEYNLNGNRYKNFYKWEDIKQMEYDYEKQGLLKRIMSNRIVNTHNVPLKMILEYYEKSFIFIMKYIDRLKHFKDPCWKNR